MRHALHDARDALFRAGHTTVTDWDALVECATRSLGSSSSPARRDRYRTLAHLDTGLHLDTGHATDGARGWLNAGPALPDAVWRQITCDGIIQPVWTTGGTPVNLGRTTRTVPQRVRRLILDRDRTCRHPGCGSTHRLEVHHLIHWADGGRTDTSDLAALCPTHHRSHHHGDFTIEGPTGTGTGTDTDIVVPADADRRDGLVFRHRHGWIIRPGPTITPPSGHPPLELAKPYQHLAGERSTACGSTSAHHRATTDSAVRGSA